MADSRLHKLRARWERGIIPLPLILSIAFARHNFDVGEFKARRKKLREDIADREMKKELGKL